MFCLVVLSFVHVQSGVGVHGVCVCLSVVVCHNIVLCRGTQQQTRTHTMNTNTTLHMKTVTNPMILMFRTKQTSGGSKVKEHLDFHLQYNSHVGRGDHRQICITDTGAIFQGL